MLDEISEDLSLVRCQSEEFGEFLFCYIFFKKIDGQFLERDRRWELKIFFCILTNTDNIQSFSMLGEPVVHRIEDGAVDSVFLQFFEGTDDHVQGFATIMCCETFHILEEKDFWTACLYRIETRKK